MHHIHNRSFVWSFVVIAMLISGCTTAGPQEGPDGSGFWKEEVAVYDKHTFMPLRSQAGDIPGWRAVAVFDTVGEKRGEWQAVLLINESTGIVSHWISPCWLLLEDATARSCGDRVMVLAAGEEWIWPLHPKSTVNVESETSANAHTYKLLRQDGSTGGPLPPVVAKRLGTTGVVEHLEFSNGVVWNLLGRHVPPSGAALAPCQLSLGPFPNLSHGNRPVLLNEPRYLPFPVEHAVEVLESERPETANAPILHTQLAEQLHVTQETTLPVVGHRQTNRTATATWAMMPVLDEMAYAAEIEVYYVGNPVGEWELAGGRIVSWNRSDAALPISLTTLQTDFGSALEHLLGDRDRKILSIAMSHAINSDEPETHVFISMEAASEEAPYLAAELHTGNVVFAQYGTAATSCRPIL